MSLSSSSQAPPPPAAAPEPVRPSPWSTPRRSEYGEGFIEIKEEDEDEEVVVGGAEGVGEEGGGGAEEGSSEEQLLVVREMGDGEPSPEYGVEEEAEADAKLEGHKTVVEHSKPVMITKEKETTEGEGEETVTKVVADSRRGREEVKRRGRARSIETKKTDMNEDDSVSPRRRKRWNLPRQEAKEMEETEIDDKRSSPKKVSPDREQTRKEWIRKSQEKRKLKQQQQQQQQRQESETRKEDNKKHLSPPPASEVLRESGEGVSADNSPSKFQRRQERRPPRPPPRPPPVAIRAKAPTGGAMAAAAEATEEHPSTGEKVAGAAEAAAAAESSSSSSGATTTTLSPRKRKRTAVVRTRARDVIELPLPYNRISSDDVKRWEAELNEVGCIDEANEANKVVSELSFTNALILKINQLSKQGLLRKMTIFSFACHVSNFEISEEDRARCVRSFFMFARRLSSIREAIVGDEQKKQFDLEEASWVPPVPAREKPGGGAGGSRPPTAKPRDPDSYQFTDENLANDYKKLFEAYQRLKEQETQQQQQQHRPGGRNLVRSVAQQQQEENQARQQQQQQQKSSPSKKRLRQPPSLEQTSGWRKTRDQSR